MIVAIDVTLTAGMTVEEGMTTVTAEGVTRTETAVGVTTTATAAGATIAADLLSAEERGLARVKNQGSVNVLECLKLKLLLLYEHACIAEEVKV
jgi:hypothetical protein